jgi:hypothetical protein
LITHQLQNQYTLIAHTSRTKKHQRLRSSGIEKDAPPEWAPNPNRRDLGRARVSDVATAESSVLI